jgi:glycerol kinase
MQFQADIMNGTIRRPLIRETTALGAAYLAGLAVGFWDSLEELRSLWRRDRTFEPAMEDPRRQQLVEGWHRAVGRSLDWAE